MRTVRFALAVVVGFLALGRAAGAQLPVDSATGGQNQPDPLVGPPPAGGSWQGPGDTPSPATGATTAGGGIPAPQDQPGGTSGSVPATPGSAPTGQQPARPRTVPIPIFGEDVAAWELWWSYNRDRFLAVKAALYRDDEQRAQSVPAGTGLTRRRPDPRFVADRVLPALAHLLETETDPALLAESALALARADAGRGWQDGASNRVSERLVTLVAHSDLGVVESAVLALGIHARTSTVPLLAALVEDAPAGRAACARESVPTRVRALAAYALGLVAQRCGRQEVARYAVHVLSRPLERGARAPQDLSGACAVALGLTPPGEGLASDGGEPPSASTAALAQFLIALVEDAEANQVVRAQAAASVGRVAAGSDAARAGAIAWAADVARDAARPSLVRQGAFLALGRLGRPTMEPPDLLARGALAAGRADTDRLARAFALMSLAEIGARARTEPEREAALAVQAVLLEEFAAAKGSAYGFAALALGVLAHDSALVAAVDGNRALKDGWKRASSPSEEAAVGLALGLRLDVTSTLPSLERFVKEGDVRAKSALALGLGLAGGAEALPALREATQADNHPVVIRDAAIGRALLGDETVGPELAGVLESTKSLLAADYAGDALGWVGDAAVLGRLVDLVRDTEAPAARRTRAVRALGAAADTELLPWNEPLRRGAHYGAPLESLTNGVGTGVLDRR